VLPDEQAPQICQAGAGELRLDGAVEQIPARSHLHLRRGFGWGILTLLDSPNGQAPDLHDHRFAGSASGMTIVVRHAQDIDATVLDNLAPDDTIPETQVTVHVWIATEPLESSDYSSLLTVTGGRIVIGDGDPWQTLDLPAGSWQAQVTVSPTDAPEQVEIVLSPLHLMPDR
jgi:hypothetical protein